MLTIQPQITKTAFNARKSNEEENYRRNYSEIEEQRDEFLTLANDTETPSLAKKALKGGIVVTSALLGGMASGWGAKKTMQGLSKLNKTNAVKNLKSYIANIKDFILSSAKSLKKVFVESDMYKKPAKFIGEKYNKFAKTKFGKFIVKYGKKAGEAVKKAYAFVKEHVAKAYEKVTSIKKEAVKSAIANTVAVSGGVASGVNAMKAEDGVIE